jgi:acetyl esterase/lipase
MDRGTGTALRWWPPTVLLAGALLAPPVLAQEVTIAKRDYRIDAVDPGIELFVREKMADGNTRFTDDNVVLFLHGATFPSTPDFDLEYQDYSWADRLVRDGFVVYMVDYRN